MKYGVRFIALSVLVSALTGCGSVSSDRNSSSGAGGGAAADAGLAGTGGGGSGAGAPVACGGESCQVNAVAHSLGVVPCCADADTSSCGGVDGDRCLPLGQVGRVDSACPSAVLLLQLPLEGCCRPDDRCGIDYASVGWGCVAREDIEASMLSAAPLEGMTCQYQTEDGVDAGIDAGSEALLDAGGSDAATSAPDDAGI